MREESEESFIERCEDVTPRDRRNLARMLWILGGWAVAFLAVSMGLKRGLLPEGPMLWAAAALPTVAGILVIVAYARFLREADELQRVIHHQALSLGFGVGWLALTAVAVLDRIVTAVDGVEIVTMAMVISYSLWLFVSRLRYR